MSFIEESFQNEMLAIYRKGRRAAYYGFFKRLFGLPRPRKCRHFRQVFLADHSFDWLAVFAVPAAVTLGILVLCKMVQDGSAKLPFTRQPLRSAGEAASAEAEGLFASVNLLLFLLCGGLPFLGIILSLSGCRLQRHEHG